MSVHLPVCLSVTILQTDSSFFVSRWNRAIFWPSVLHVALHKAFLDFWFTPPNAKNLLPKICTKSPISRLVWHIDRRCLGLLGVFGDDRFNGTMQNVVGQPLLPWQRNCTRRGDLSRLPACYSYFSNYHYDWWIKIISLMDLSLACYLFSACC